MNINLKVDNDVENNNSYFVRWIKETALLLNNASSIQDNRDIQIVVSGNFKFPETFNSLSPVLIKLAVENTAYWAQIVFQFAHEYCHYLINSPANPATDDEWFEEVICECASRYVLLKLNNDAEAQKYFNGSFKEYALSRENTLEEENFALNSLNEESLLLKRLRHDHGLRKHFNHIANLIMPIILYDDSFWQSIPGLAHFKNDNTFIENLNTWYRETPDSVKPQVAKIIKLFGND